MSSVRRLLALTALALTALAAAAPGCATDLGATTTNACSSKDVFEMSGVSTFMERRCGTLDCHGVITRPMRLYGQLGLRRAPVAQGDPENVPGGAATTQGELDANYASVCNVDAEKMNASVANLGNTAEQLLIVRKARGEEKHKGGKVVNAGDSGDLCILQWLQAAKASDVASACQKAIDQLN